MPSYRSASTPRRGSGFLVRALFVAATFALLPACGAGGGGGGGGGSSPGALAVAQPTPLSAGVGVPYSATLQAVGGLPPYAWAVHPSSTLPSGFSLSASGVLSGQSSTLGQYAFTAIVTDSASPPASDQATYTLTVSAFDASVALLHWGDAWTGDPYPLYSVGGANVTYSVVTNQSGASITGANPSLGTATYVAGPATGTDVVRATSTTGDTKDVTIPVVANPVANMTARFSNSDVWYVRAEGKRDSSHAFATDFDAAMASLGLRAQTSTGATGTPADEIARAYVRRQILREANVFYHNAADGSALSGGLAISFPFVEPSAPHFAPAAGAVNGAASNQYNVITMHHGGGGGVVGTAYLDNPNNGSQENDTTSGSSGDLGVFVDGIAYYVGIAYSNNTLPNAPIGASDVSILKALLYGTGGSGARYLEIQRIANGFARTVASVMAHEVGHSLGLNHTSPSQQGSIMNSSTFISPTASYAFTTADVATLQGALPGPNRGGVPVYVEGADVVGLLTVGPDEGVVGGAPICECHAGCVLRHRARAAAKATVGR